MGDALAVMDADTRIIPGHGGLAGRADLRDYADALKGMRAAVAALVARDHTRQEVLDARPIRRWAEAWGQSEAAERSFTETLYVSLGGR